MKDFNAEDSIECLSSEEKYDLLNRINDSDYINEKDLEILNILSNDKGDEIRAQVAEILANSDSPDAEKILVKLLRDKDGLTRAIACDSLRYSNSLEVLNLLMDIIQKDKTDLVRGYSAASIASILINTNKIEKNYIDIFYDLLNKEKVKWVKLNFYKSLYLLGEDSYLFKLIGELSNKQFRKRALVVNILFDIVSNKNQEIIKSSLIEMLQKEKTVLVRSVIEDVLKHIEEDNLKP